ncbi:hypothetical protein [uncultured Dubosiella sp.]|uniref:hypothetical protein n=1 Tax=uncultured Dubosiella sp. TaxID=1937011 RepID=UPI00260FD958|nr:hypothetical protein [uncultured Dubosiella sp.]
MNKVFTPQELSDLGKKIEKAENDPTPFAVYAGDVDSVQVVGDSSKSYPLKKIDFVATFRFFKNVWIEKFGDIPEDAEVTNNFVVLKVKYDDIAITPRNDAMLLAQIIDFFGYFESEREIVQKYEDDIKKLGEETGVEFIRIDNGVSTSDPQKDADAIKKGMEIYNNYMRDSIRLYAYQSDDAQIALYNFVGILLGIEDDMLAHLTSFSVLEILAATIQKYPEFFNETDTVFGS